MIDISVIVTTKNEAVNIENCLQAIENQAYPAEKREIIVVDNNSSDNTKEIAGKFTDRIYNFGPERSAQRNFGARQASGRYIIFLDADMNLSEGVLSECFEKCAKEGCVALYIPERITGTGPWSRARDFERSFYNATCIDCVRFVSRDKFLEINGFDEKLTGPEDWDFDRRIKNIGSVGIINAPIYHNEEGMTLKKYLQKKEYYSRSFERYSRKWGGDRIIKMQLGFFYRYFWVFMEDGKWKKLFTHPILALKVFFLRIMVGFGYIISRQASKTQ